MDLFLSLALLGSAVLLLAVETWRRSVLSRRKGFPPGPPSLPLLGSLPFVSGDGPRPSLFHGSRSLVEKYGKVVGFHVGRMPAVLVSDFSALREVLRSADACSRPPIYPFNQAKAGHRAPNLEGRGPGILLSQGRTWSEQRRFVMRSLRDFGFGKADSMEALFHQEVAKLGDLLEKRRGVDDKPVELVGSLGVSVVNSLWSIMVGEQFDLEDPELSDLLVLMDKLLRETSPLSPMSLVLPKPEMVQWPVLRDLSGYSTAKKFFGEIESFLGKRILQHRRTLDAESPPRDLLDVLLAKVDAEGDPLSPFFNGRDKNNNSPSELPSSVSDLGFGDLSVLNILIDLFMAGMDTTASSLAWTFLYLLHHPEAQRRAQRELDEVVGRDRLPLLSDRPSLPYCSAVLHESLRLTGFVFLSFPHFATEDVQVEGGRYTIPKGTTIMPNLYHVMNDPDYWNNPRSFKPERFLDADSGEFRPDERVVPFSMGRRVCPGQSLAEMELFVFFACLMQRFSMERHPGETEPLPGFAEMDSCPEGNLRSPPRFRVRLVSR